MTHEVAHHAWTIVSDISEIEPLVASAVNMCASASVSPRACRFNIPIALTEALSNAIVRGNHSDRRRHVTVALAVDERRVVFEITDEGGGFNPVRCHFLTG